MPEHLFGISLSKYLECQKAVRETGHPLPSVPVYYFHSFEQSFCANVHCPCQVHQQAVVRLFVSLIEGRLDLEPATALSTESGKERHA